MSKRLRWLAIFAVFSATIVLNVVGDALDAVGSFLSDGISFLAKIFPWPPFAFFDIFVNFITWLISSLVTGFINTILLFFMVGVEAFLFFDNPRYVDGINSYWADMLPVYAFIVVVMMLVWFVQFTLIPDDEEVQANRMVSRVILSGIFLAVSREIYGLAVLLTHELSYYLYPTEYSFQYAGQLLEVVLSSVTFGIGMLVLGFAGMISVLISGLTLYIILAMRMLIVYMIYAMLPLLIGLWVVDVGIGKYGAQIAQFAFKLVAILLFIGVIVSGVFAVGAAYGVGAGGELATQDQAGRLSGSSGMFSGYVDQDDDIRVLPVGDDRPRSLSASADGELQTGSSVGDALFRLFMFLGSAWVVIAGITSFGGVLLSAGAASAGGTGGFSGLRGRRRSQTQPSHGPWTAQKGNVSTGSMQVHETNDGRIAVTNPAGGGAVFDPDADPLEQEAEVIHPSESPFTAFPEGAMDGSSGSDNLSNLDKSGTSVIGGALEVAKQPTVEQSTERAAELLDNWGHRVTTKPMPEEGTQEVTPGTPGGPFSGDEVPGDTTSEPSVGVSDSVSGDSGIGDVHIDPTNAVDSSSRAYDDVWFSFNETDRELLNDHGISPDVLDKYGIDKGRVAQEMRLAEAVRKSPERFQKMIYGEGGVPEEGLYSSGMETVPEHKKLLVDDFGMNAQQAAEMANQPYYDSIEDLTQSFRHELRVERIHDSLGDVPPRLQPGVQETLRDIRQVDSISDLENVWDEFESVGGLKHLADQFPGKFETSIDNVGPVEFVEEGKQTYAVTIDGDEQVRALQQGKFIGVDNGEEIKTTVTGIGGGGTELEDGEVYAFNDVQLTKWDSSIGITHDDVEVDDEGFYPQVKLTPQSEIMTKKDLKQLEVDSRFDAHDIRGGDTIGGIEREVGRKPLESGATMREYEDRYYGSVDGVRYEHEKTVYKHDERGFIDEHLADSEDLDTESNDVTEIAIGYGFDVSDGERMPVVSFGTNKDAPTLNSGEVYNFEDTSLRKYSEEFPASHARADTDAKGDYTQISLTRESSAEQLDESELTEQQTFGEWVDDQIVGNAEDFSGRRSLHEEETELRKQRTTETTGIGDAEAERPDQDVADSNLFEDDFEEFKSQSQPGDMVDSEVTEGEQGDGRVVDDEAAEQPEQNLGDSTPNEDDFEQFEGHSESGGFTSDAEENDKSDGLPIDDPNVETTQSDVQDSGGSGDKLDDSGSKSPADRDPSGDSRGGHSASKNRDESSKDDKHETTADDDFFEDDPNDGVGSDSGFEFGRSSDSGTSDGHSQNVANADDEPIGTSREGMSDRHEWADERREQQSDRPPYSEEHAETRKDVVETMRDLRSANEPDQPDMGSDGDNIN